MVQRRAFTDPFIRALKAKPKPYKLSEHAEKGEGRLLVRVLPNGTKEFFYRYRTNDQDKTLALGRYDPAGKNGKTLAGIRTALRGRRDVQRETGDVKAHLASEKRTTALEARKGSLTQLLTAYTDWLRASNKPSAGDVESIFRVHVVKPFPTLAKGRAKEVSPNDIQTILARMVNAGITRQVNKARANLHAAFNYGGKADNDPRTTAKDGVMFGLTSNPVSLVPVIAEYERTGERVLDETELRHYWKGLEALPLVQCATLRLNLALACQRPTQLIRARWEHFDFSEDTLLLRDSKGRGAARDHLLPLTVFVLQQLEPLRKLNGGPVKAGEEGPTPFSSVGNLPMAIKTLTDAVRDVSKALKKTHKIPKFDQRALRRTAETMLQRMRVDKEVRAHLLSHGRSRGVQGKHYERYDFLAEKRAALEKWASHIQRIISGKSLAKIVPVRATALRQHTKGRILSRRDAS